MEQRHRTTRKICCGYTKRLTKSRRVVDKHNRRDTAVIINSIYSREGARTRSQKHGKCELFSSTVVATIGRNRLKCKVVNTAVPSTASATITSATMVANVVLAIQRKMDDKCQCQRIAIQRQRPHAGRARSKSFRSRLKSILKIDFEIEVEIEIGTTHTFN